MSSLHDFCHSEFLPFTDLHGFSPFFLSSISLRPFQHDFHVLDAALSAPFALQLLFELQTACGPLIFSAAVSCLFNLIWLHLFLTISEPEFADS